MKENTTNDGFDPTVIKEYKDKIRASGTSFIYDEEEDNTEDYVHFYFVGEYEKREVVYDAVVYTLRLQHQSKLYEIAEQRALNHFPKFKKVKQSSDDVGLKLPAGLEEEIGLYMAEVIMDLEDDDQVKVKEHLETDTETEFGISIDAVLNVTEVTPEVIEKFIKDFKCGTLDLDPTLYSFQAEDEGE